MKNFYKYIGLGAIMLFSFYYTEKIALIMQSKNPLVIAIESAKKDYEVDSVDAQIIEDTIIPGLTGKAVNVEKSFANMKNIGAFHEAYLDFDVVYPAISLEKNKDKVIKEGNAKKKSVALLIESEELKRFSEEKGIEATLLVTTSTYSKDTSLEQINYDTEKTSVLNSMLTEQKKNKQICILPKLEKQKCQKEGYYLVEPTLTYKKANVLDVKQNVFSGAIILVDKQIDANYYSVLISWIKYQGLKIVPLSELIGEANE